MTDEKEQLSDDELIIKKYARMEIEDGYEPYFESGGTVKKYPTFDPEVYALCDVYIPGEGSIQSDPDIKDTKIRVPRPEKKFGKKS